MRFCLQAVPYGYAYRPAHQKANLTMRAAWLTLAAALSVPYKLSPHLANDVVKQMLRQMPELIHQEGQRVIGRMPGSVLPIVVDDPDAALDEDEEEDEGEYDAMDDENETPLRNETGQAIESG